MVSVWVISSSHWLQELRFISSNTGIGATINRCVWSVQITALSRVKTIVLQWMAVHWEPTGKNGLSTSMTDRMRGLSIRQSPSVLYNFILRLLEDLRIRSSFSMNFFLSSRAVVSQECEGDKDFLNPSISIFQTKQSRRQYD